MNKNKSNICITPPITNNIQFEKILASNILLCWFLALELYRHFLSAHDGALAPKFRNQRWSTVLRHSLRYCYRESTLTNCRIQDQPIQYPSSWVFYWAFSYRTALWSQNRWIFRDIKPVGQHSSINTNGISQRIYKSKQNKELHVDPRHLRYLKRKHFSFHSQSFRLFAFSKSWDTVKHFPNFYKMVEHQWFHCILIVQEHHRQTVLLREEGMHVCQLSRFKKVRYAIKNVL